MVNYDSLYDEAAKELPDEGERLPAYKFDRIGDTIAGTLEEVRFVWKSKLGPLNPGENDSRTPELHINTADGPFQVLCGPLNLKRLIVNPRDEGGLRPEPGEKVVIELVELKRVEKGTAKLFHMAVRGADGALRSDDDDWAARVTGGAAPAPAPVVTPPPAPAQRALI